MREEAKKIINIDNPNTGIWAKGNPAERKTRFGKRHTAPLNSEETNRKKEEKASAGTLKIFDKDGEEINDEAKLNKLRASALSQKRKETS
ncbi:hypothetical protein KKC67_01380 [Patescibacteria group bacterium]|nr:hypothetical protein [Patescibacteria group bacterium]MBU0879726.1 hypothetical protein [Patescibacteria group bacterium]MBU0880055.1 hypothetical protein [Patescibacteria group bacterium]MBU0897953.1 hypothetical protein [Patescibacteria group bacterium]MBU1062764.1 hypothetical protein [Patescibacteria group bacterium]